MKPVGIVATLAHTVSLRIQVRWGERCNPCTPIVFLIELTLGARIGAAVAVGVLARRLTA